MKVSRVISWSFDGMGICRVGVDFCAVCVDAGSRCLSG
jgi:hypothetical protein